jgi:hypothetical protein
MDLIKLLTEQLGNEEILNKLGGKAGVDPSKVQEVAKIGLPSLIKAMNQNASTEDGAQALAKALEQHKDDEVDDLGGYLDKVDTQDGAKILQHILSGEDASFKNNLANKTGLKSQQVSGILNQLAPMLMGMMGKEKADRGSGANVQDLLGDLLGQGSKGGFMDIAEGLLDSDKDGSIVDDVGKLFGGFFKK